MMHPLHLMSLLRLVVLIKMFPFKHLPLRVPALASFRCYSGACMLLALC